MVHQRTVAGSAWFCGAHSRGGGEDDVIFRAGVSVMPGSRSGWTVSELGCPRASRPAEESHPSGRLAPQSVVERAVGDFGVVSLSPTLGVEIA